ncbi:MAG: DUF5681 domain-containing protein [Acidobacteriaceae bacterium]
MRKENMSDRYEVGYGKPPRNTQFQKGVSGNPRGRPKKALDFDRELLRQSRATITLNENGNRRSVSKHEAAILQLLNKAIGGNVPALRTYLAHYQVASEKIALQTSQARYFETCPARELPWDELEKQASEIIEKRAKEKKKGDISNED